MNILVADDSKLIRNLLAEIIQKLRKCKVHQAANGREALDIVENNSEIELAFLDWRMPEMNGIDVIRHIRSHSHHHSIPIVVVSSFNQKEKIATALKAGANEYIMKPFDPETIEQKLLLMGYE